MEALITVLPGDGIGPEVCSAGVRVLEAVGDRYGHRFETSEQLSRKSSSPSPSSSRSQASPCPSPSVSVWSGLKMSGQLSTVVPLIASLGTRTRSGEAGAALFHTPTASTFAPVCNAGNPATVTSCRT